MPTSQVLEAPSGAFNTHYSTTKIRVHCGCKENFDSIAAGEAHARLTGHTLTIAGEIRVQRY